MNNMLLIGGSGRSGTTILNRAVGRHPDVTDVSEWRFTTDPDGIVDFYTQCATGVQSPFHFDVRLRRLEALLTSVADKGLAEGILGAARFRHMSSSLIQRNLSPAYARIDATAYSPNFKQYVTELIENLSSFVYDGYWVGMSSFDKTRLAFSDKSREEVRLACQAFLRAVAADVCAAQGAKFHLEKNTWNILCWDRTREILPESRLVHIVRDPRDVVASYSNQSWVPSDPLKAARILAFLMDQWDKVSKAVPSNSYHEVRLEDLTEDPEREFRAICEFWGLDWSQELLATELRATSFGRWKRDLTKAQIKGVTELVQPIMEKYDYVDY